MSRCAMPGGPSSSPILAAIMHCFRGRPRWRVAKAALRWIRLRVSEMALHVDPLGAVVVSLQLCTPPCKEIFS